MRAVERDYLALGNLATSPITGGRLKPPRRAQQSPFRGSSLLHAILDIIIGPTVYAAPMYWAFVEALTKAGMTDAGSRVVISGIPIRS
jgi:hypothetical protein